jgi:ABC-type multidrug transport system fused ATPase/permease subunit
VHTWDGKKWNFSSDWYQADEQILKPMVKAGADKYLADKKDTPRRGGLPADPLRRCAPSPLSRCAREGGRHRRGGAALARRPGGRAGAASAVVAQAAANPKGCSLSIGTAKATPWTQNIVLNVNGIEVIYNHVILVLKGVSLQVPEGGIVAMLGGNGAGKTTTLRAISNLLKGERGEVTKGSIELRGERIENLSPADLVKRGVVQVMEGRHCFAHLTIEENLLTGAYTRTSKGEIAANLEKVYNYFPRLKTRRTSRRPTPRAASSRCAPSAAR